MKIMLLSRYFPPEIGTAATLFYELAHGLYENGHNVTVVTNFPWYNLEKVPEKYRKGIYLKENFEGIDVVRVRFPLWGPKILRLIIGHMTVPFSTIIGGLKEERPDVIFVYSPPLFMGISGWILSKFKKAPFVFGVQDLHPQCYIDQGKLNDQMLVYLLEILEKFCYRKASLITVHSQGNKDHIANRKGIEGKKIFIVPNWIDTENMKPLQRRNEFSEKHGLNDKFVVGYAGTLGMSQGLLSLVEAANILKEKRNIEFFIVGDGIEKEKMVEKANEYALKNIRFLPMQPRELYPLVVASSDVSLVTLNSNVKTPVVPSKILSIMAASRPVLGSMPLSGDAPLLIKDAECGICIGPESPEELAEKILYLSENRDVCERFSKNGRNYVVEKFSLKKAVKYIEELFAGLIGN